MTQSDSATSAKKIKYISSDVCNQIDKICQQWDILKIENGDQEANYRLQLDILTKTNEKLNQIILEKDKKLNEIKTWMRSQGYYDLFFALNIFTIYS